LANCPKPLEALLFSIYLLAIISMSSEECLKYFDESRTQLLKRFQAGARQALMAADLFHTRELEVLQAFVLFLVGLMTVCSYLVANRRKAGRSKIGYCHDAVGIVCTISSQDGARQRKGLKGHFSVRGRDENPPLVANRHTGVSPS
jgi:hypothetical protein